MTDAVTNAVVPVHQHNTFLRIATNIAQSFTNVMVAAAAVTVSLAWNTVYTNYITYKHPDDDKKAKFDHSLRYALQFTVCVMVFVFITRVIFHGTPTGAAAYYGF